MTSPQFPLAVSSFRLPWTVPRSVQRNPGKSPTGMQQLPSAAKLQSWFDDRLGVVRVQRRVCTSTRHATRRNLLRCATLSYCYSNHFHNMMGCRQGGELDVSGVHVLLFGLLYEHTHSMTLTFCESFFCFCKACS